MSELRVTLVDVGWGDSIIIESTDAGNGKHYALIDSNDSAEERSTMIFLKRFFGKSSSAIADGRPWFEFIVLSHFHGDHGKGLKRVMREYGTEEFWYPKSNDRDSLSELMSYVSKPYARVEHHEAINSTKALPSLGDASMRVLWPHYNQIDDDEENNNSVVLALELGGVTFLLTGDAHGEVWEQIGAEIPDNTRFFKVPHHGSKNGTFLAGNRTPWLDHCPSAALLGISCHPLWFNHPRPEVTQAFDNRHYRYYQTNKHYHLTFSTDGHGVEVKYYH